MNTLMEETEIEELDGEGIVIDPAILDMRKHNGFVTIKNPATGNHRTFKIYTVRSGPLKGRGIRRWAILTQGDVYEDVGVIGRGRTEGRVFAYPRLHSSPGQKRSFYEIVADILQHPAHWNATKGAEFRISGTCRRCNRRLTHPESIDSGFGPECVKMGMHGI